MKTHHKLALLVLLLGLILPVWSNPKPHPGQGVYVKHCAECHGERGQGVEDEYSKPLIGDWPLEKIIRYVDKTMPDYEPELVKGKEAEEVSKFIFESFYQKPELFKKDSKVQLARLTNRQFRQSLSDLFAQIEGQAQLINPKSGLSAKYYNSEGMNKKKKQHSERLDPIIKFDFGEKAPFEGMNPKKFSVFWDGSIMPRESGLYTFYVKSPNGFLLRINQKEGLPTIDGKVTDGIMREVSADVFLLGGRPYPLKLEYYKFDDPNASIELSWKTPVGEKEIIPAEFLFSKTVPHSFVSKQKLPPDDSSHGYKRGIHIDSSWYEAITFAALEASAYAAGRVNRLIQTKQGDEREKQKVIQIAESFVRLAFRERLSKEELSLFVHSKFNDQTPLETSVEKVVLACLKSPRFLYPELQALTKKKIDSATVATRLALYFWDSIPDKKLNELVDRGQLVKKGQIESQANRMLNDPRSKAKFNDFLFHWLEMKTNELPTKSKKYYPDFSPQLALDLRRSLINSIEKIIWEKEGTFEDLIKMPSIEYNQRIAEFYDLVYPQKQNSSGFISGNSALSGRFGLHTHPYLLASHSYSKDSSPIHRGVFVSRKILGRTLRPPKVAVSFSNTDFDPSWTMRQKVTSLTKSANCMSCHDLINSTGFLLEGFDATGRTRSQADGKSIDLSVKFVDGGGNDHDLKGPKGLLELALSSPKPSKHFIEELFKHLAKQPIESYSTIDLIQLSQMLSQNKINLSKLYFQLALQAATDGFEF